MSGGCLNHNLLLSIANGLAGERRARSFEREQKTVFGDDVL